MIKKSIDQLKSWAKHLKSEIYTLYVAMRDPRTPTYARYLAIFIIGYALSPIDLIPDFIPVLGLVDDLIILPLGIALLRRMIPPVVMATSRRQAEAMIRSGLPASRTAAMIILAIWALVITVLLWWATNQLLYPRPIERMIEPPPYSADQNTLPPADKISPSTNDSDRSRSRER